MPWSNGVLTSFLVAWYYEMGIFEPLQATPSLKIITCPWKFCKKNSCIMYYYLFFSFLWILFEKRSLLCLTGWFSLIMYSAWESIMQVTCSFPNLDQCLMLWETFFDWCLTRIMCVRNSNIGFLFIVVTCSISFSSCLSVLVRFLPNPNW